MEILLEAVFSMWSAPSLYHDTDQVQSVSEELIGELVSAVKYSEWSEMVGEQSVS
jgi:hypothetical protein